MNIQPKIQNPKVQFINMSKASPEALSQILDAFNAEVDAALIQKKIPTLDGAFARLGHKPTVMM